MLLAKLGAVWQFRVPYSPLLTFLEDGLLGANLIAVVKATALEKRDSAFTGVLSRSG